MLVARRADRLQQLADELSGAHRIAVTVVPLDLSLPRAGERLASELAARGIQITSLVNNAGFGTHGAFHDEDPARLRDEIAVNVASVVDLSRAFIVPLREAGRGVLINVSSLAGYMPFPSMAVYAASKAFVLHFTEALWYESLGSGLRVIALSPGATETEFFEVLGENADGGRPREKPQTVVATVLRALDQHSPPPSVISGRLNSFLVLAGRLLSRRSLIRLAAAAAGRSSQSTGTA